jgi:hypothetical protein
LQVAARDVVMGADLSAAKAAEKALGHVRASAVLGIGFRVIDALRQEAAFQIVSIRGLVSVHD